MIRRTGVTLMEVLVAIFVAAIGLLALLALFPLGALSMSQAIRDGRTSACASTAYATAETWQVRNDPVVVFDQTKLPLQVDVFINGAGAVLPPVLGLPYDGPSYPVYVDPIGISANAGATLPSLAGLPGIPRQNTSITGNSTLARRWFTLLDDITFGDNALPSLNGLQVQRDLRYSWAYMLRRPRYQVTSVVDLTVVVYSGRPLQLGVGETAYTGVTFDPTLNYVTVTPAPGQDRPAVRNGSWILDATMVDATGTIPDPHGFFYRVVNVTENPGPTFTLELQTNPKKATTVGQVVVLDNVVEVFEKGPGWLP